MMAGFSAHLAGVHTWKPCPRSSPVSRGFQQATGVGGQTGSKAAMAPVTREDGIGTAGSLPREHPAGARCLL